MVTTETTRLLALADRLLNLSVYASQQCTDRLAYYDHDAHVAFRELAESLEFEADHVEALSVSAVRERENSSAKQNGHAKKTVENVGEVRPDAAQ
jgi:hypothetical protein